MKITEDFSPRNKYWDGDEVLAEFGGICFHITAGHNSRHYFKTTNRTVSCNYLIERDGTVVQMVPSGSISWASNPLPQHRKQTPFFFNPNRHRSFNQVLISIEVELKESERISPKQYQQLVALCNYIHELYELPRERTRWFGHKDLDKNKRDPNFDIDELFDHTFLQEKQGLDARLERMELTLTKYMLR